MTSVACRDEDKEEIYESYRSLFTGMFSRQTLNSGLNVFLTKGMKEWLLMDINEPPPVTPQPAVITDTAQCDEIITLLASMIGGF